jgi:hypothetical protein
MLIQELVIVALLGQALVDSVEHIVLIELMIIYKQQPLYRQQMIERYVCGSKFLFSNDHGMN